MPSPKELERQVRALEREVAYWRDQVEGPRVVHVPDTVDPEVLKQRFLEAAAGPGQKVLILSEERPRPVPFLPVPAEGTCGKEPPEQWCAGALREVYPHAAGVSQCARTPNHPSPCIGIVWTPGPHGYVAEQVMFP